MDTQDVDMIKTLRSHCHEIARFYLHLQLYFAKALQLFLSALSYHDLISILYDYESTENS